MDSDGAEARAGDPETVREIFESMPIMLVGLTGRDHRFVAANAVYRALVEREDCTGLTLAEVAPEVAGQQLFEMADRVFETGTSQEAHGWRIQLEAKRGSGDLRDHYLDFTMAPRTGPDGAVVGLNYFGVEVTERILEHQRVEREAADAVRRYEQARDVIKALQRQLLPAGLPVLPSVRLAGSYLLADADDAAGGDWFDAVPVAGGRVALVVGDVVGHGVAASAAMGQLRAVLQDRLDETGDILAAVAAADRMAERRMPGARAATVCVVLLDPADGALTYCSAGHPPPLIAGSGNARFLPASGEGPLGVGAEHSARHDRLEPGEVLLLYSDGIIERPGRTPAAATAELCQVAGDIVAGRGLIDSDLSTVDRFCLQTLELLVRQTGHTDDITLLAAQRRIPAPALRLGPVTSPSVGIVRAAVDAWISVHEASEEDRVALAHAVVELVTNAVEHGRRGTGEAAVSVTVELRDDGEAWMTVEDDGRWREQERPGDSAGDRGYGLAMTRALTEHLDIHRGERGTTVTARRHLSRSARLLTADQISAGVPGTPPELRELLLLLDQPNAPGRRIAIHGPIDASNIDQLGVELDRRTLGGSHELLVDLTAVTHLASAAVAELYRTAPDGRRPLLLYAPPGSTANHVLTLVGLPHATVDPHA